MEQGLALRGRAHACIDISDGLASDLGHILTASRCGAVLDVEKLVAPDLRALEPAGQALSWALDGGDDYELCFTCASETAASLGRDPALAACRPVGVIENGSGLRLRRPDGGCDDYQGHGYRHF